MEFTPIFPERTDRKPPSNIVKAYPKSAIHPLLAIGGQNGIRAQFTISTWLTAGACLQSLLLLLPVPVIYTVLPSIALLTYKILNTYLILYNLKPNPLMEGIVTGRHSAIIPSSDGSFARPPGSSIGGGGVCVFLLGARSNSPLGILSPNFTSLSKHFKSMLQALEATPDHWGFLGGSTYANTSDRLTQPESLHIMYFRTSAHLRAFARGRAHQDAWDWYVRNEKALGDVGISHEMYDVPEGRWETVYANYRPSNFAATSHLIEEMGGTQKGWACPIVRGDAKALKTSKGRMGFMNISAGEGNSSDEKGY